MSINKATKTKKATTVTTAMTTTEVEGVDKTILRVAYLLSILDEGDREQGKKTFEDVAKDFSDFLPGKSEAVKLVLEVI